MNWNHCFSAKRYGQGSQILDERSDYERDWDRIIFSSPFRRLQNKTQVFPLPDDIFVHNRLTHSLEVASVGRSLGSLVGEKISQLSTIKDDAKAVDFYTHHLKHVIAAGCLAHDLGNPAFGHSGEDAISKYFKKRDTDKKEDLEFKALFTADEWNDLTHFEGNANALRILTMQLNGRAKGGFRLTYSTLASVLKYPCSSSATIKKGPVHRKKYGFFQIDQPVFTDIVHTLGMMKDDTTTYTAYKRHPFVYLVEAADDICYTIIDFEDAHRLGLLSFETVKNAFLDIIKTNSEDDIERVKATADKISEDKNEGIGYLRAKAINVLTNRCKEVFIEHQDAIINGQFNSSLIDALPELKDAIQYIRTQSIKYIYNAKNVVGLEVAGFRIMSGLVADFVSAVLTPIDKREKEQEKLLELLPLQYKVQENGTPYEKVMCMLDFISGMTDNYALKLYRKLRGIEM
ncbi:MAG: dNTP triphosphohydrolase [Chitinophagaceae bacterium]|nr:MAG: dNTP triphosphohydrolase [Chitinophagaceae bacterium]